MSGNPAPGLVAALLADDPVWSAYALADLQPEMAPYCRWYVHVSSNASAVALLYSGLEPPVLLTVGDAAGLEHALAGAELPDQLYLSVREVHAPVIAHRYDHHDRRPMWRMVLEGAGELRGMTHDEAFFNAEAQRRKASRNEPPPPLPDSSPRLGASALAVSLRRLTGADVARVEALFAHGGPFTPDAFAAPQIEQGVFYGIENGAGGLAAVGGTHVVDAASGVAAIGNMYTRPDCRGRGYAGVILAAIVETVRTNGAHTIVLNVDQRNTGARRLYEKHGFRVHCAFLEGVATVRPQMSGRI